VFRARGARLSLEPGSARARDDRLRCYEALVAEGFVPAKELEPVREWNAERLLGEAGAQPTCAATRQA